MADSRHLVNRARSEAKEYRETYKSPIPAKMLADRLAQYIQAYTLYGSVRPFGVGMMIGAMDKTGPALYMVEPSGVYYVSFFFKVYTHAQGYYGCASGKGKQLAKTELEKLKFTELTAQEAVKEAARMYVFFIKKLTPSIYMVHDDVKDKDFELELSWVCEASLGKHQFVPRELALEAERLAKAAIQDEMEED